MTTVSRKQTCENHYMGHLFIMAYICHRPERTRQYNAVANVLLLDRMTSRWIDFAREHVKNFCKPVEPYATFLGSARIIPRQTWDPSQQPRLLMQGVGSLSPKWSLSIVFATTHENENSCEAQRSGTQSARWPTKRTISRNTLRDGVGRW